MENKRRVSKFLVVIISIFIFFAGHFAYGRLRDFVQTDREIERYVYPTDFSDCLVALQRKAKCRIPEEILSGMSVEELVWAVIDYPFLFEVGLSSQWEGGSEWIAADSDAFAKLIECKNAENRIVKVLKDAWESEDTDQSKVYGACHLFYISRGKYFDFSWGQLRFLEKFVRRRFGRVVFSWA